MSESARKAPSHEQFEHGLALCRQGHYREAETIVAVGLAEDPHDGWLWMLRGMTCRAQQQWENARRSLETATTLIPLPPGAQIALAECYLRESRTELARVMLVYLAREVSTPVALLAPLAQQLGTIGENELALAVCREAAEQQPDRDEPLFAMAVYMKRLNFPAHRILAVMQRAFDLAPEHRPYRLAVAFLHHLTGSAARAYRMIVNEDLDTFSCRNCLERMACIFGEVGDWERQAICQERAAALPPCDDEGLC